MSGIDYRYLPKDGVISYLEVDRNAGFASELIHMHDHEEIILVTSEAECECINNGNRFRFQAPAILINRSGTYHEVVKISGKFYASRVIFFHEDLLSNLPETLTHMETLFQNDVLILPLNENELDAVTPFFDLIKTRTNHPERMLPILLSILTETAALAADGRQILSSKIRDTYIFDVIDVIRSDLRRQITINELAEMFYVSQTKIKQDFRRITGLPIREFAVRSRLQSAMTLLKSTEYEVGEIAYRCGFSSESYFIKIFRNFFGIAPGTFRRRLKNETS
ncbi:MAG: helix-turn-helix transcriptional regulator [Lachnospiraceae bacterium]|nr:helix-turn-helix transcriptional regulator [Lachnospiraceae bacterium]